MATFATSRKLILSQSMPKGKSKRHIYRTLRTNSKNKTSGLMEDIPGFSSLSQKGNKIIMFYKYHCECKPLPVLVGNNWWCLMERAALSIKHHQFIPELVMVKTIFPQFRNFSYLATNDKDQNMLDLSKCILKCIEQSTIRIIQNMMQKENQFLFFLQHFRSVCHQKLAVAKRNNGEIRYCKYCVPESILIPLKTCGHSKKPIFIFSNELT